MKGGIGKAGQEQSQGEVKSVLEEALREGARPILEPAAEGEAAEYAERHGRKRDDKGHRLVVRDGHLPERELVTGTGAGAGASAPRARPAAGAAVRLRTDAAKRCNKVPNATAGILKPRMIAEKKFRRLSAPEQSEEIFYGRTCGHSESITRQNAEAAARSHLHTS